MADMRYPPDLVVTAQDFIESGWKDILNQASREGYPSMWQAFSEAGRKAIEEGRSKSGKALWLLADACSMMLMPSSQNEPFKPIVVFHDRRSVIPDDFSESDINFFADIVDDADDLWLKARLADLAWLKLTTRDVKFALAAIDAYRAIPLDTETWIRGGGECWERAISLARMIRSGADDRLEQIEITILASFDSTTRQDGFLGLWLADLLKANRLAWTRRFEIAQKLEALAKEFDGEGDLHRAREYFSASSEWYKSIPDDTKASEMTAHVAEGWVKEAIARVSSNNPSHMVALSFYEKAIQTYRTIPRPERAALRVDERIAELRKHLTDSGEKALGEMQQVSTPSADLTQLVEKTRKAVTGKPATEALLAFANIHRGVMADELRKSTLERMRQFPLQSLFAATVMSRDGRVVARRPPMSLGENPTQEDEIAIRAEMVKNYSILVSIVVHGDIWPAHDVLLLEHRLREADFVALANQSPIVPKERSGLFGKALFAGYDRDFVSALHLLVPQIENMVRVHLKQAGAKTTNLDQNGIENENGMSTLMDLPEAEEIFGKDFVFELKTLFCDSFGPNLRNEIAHGLLDEDSCHSPFAIYAWWLGLRLVFNTWWNRAHRENPETKETTENGHASES